MPVAGVGGLLGNWFFPDLDNRMAQHITPTGAPLAQQGGPAQPGQVDQLGNLAPPAVTQPDPNNAANIAALTQPSSAYARDAMAMARRDAMAQGVNSGLEQIAAGFGTAQQQASKQNALRGGGGVGNSLADLAGIQGMQDQTIKDNEHARFMGNAAVFGQILRGQGINVTDAQATEIMNNPELLQQIGGAAAGNATQTGDQKNFNAARTALAADLQRQHPDWKPAQIQEEVNNQIPAGVLALGAGASAEDQAYYQYAAQQRKAGLPVDDIVAWKGKHAADAQTLAQNQKDAQKFKDDALADYTPLNSKLTSIKHYVDVLDSNPAAAQEAMKMFSPATGKWGAINPLASKEVKAAAVALQKIQSELSGSGLTDVKNVRNSREFNTLAQAATGGLDASASSEDFAKSIAIIKNKFLDAQATNELANGHKLTGELIGHGNSDLLEATINGKANPYFNGGSEDANPLVGRDLEEIRYALEQHPEKRDVILDAVRKKGFSPRGL